MMTPPDVFTDEVEVDHCRWLINQAYREALLTRLAAACQPGADVLLTVAHERDDHCCRLLAGDVFNQPKPVPIHPHSKGEHR